MTHNRDAITAVTNIENALLQLECFPNKRKAALEMIDQILAEMNDGGLEARDKWRHDLFISIKLRLLNLFEQENQYP